MPDTPAPLTERPQWLRRKSSTTTTTSSIRARGRSSARFRPSSWRSVRSPGCTTCSSAAPIIFGIGIIGVLYTMASWWADVIREAQYKGDHTRVVQISHRYGMILFIASEVMFFVAWFWAFFNSSLFPGDPVHATRDALFGGVLAAQGHRGVRSLASAAAQHADPADLRHHGDLGASRAAGERPPGPEIRPDPDHPARRDLHLRAGL